MGRIANDVETYFNNGFVRSNLGLALSAMGKDVDALQIWFKEDLCSDTRKIMDTAYKAGAQCGVGLGPKTRASSVIKRESIEFNTGTQVVEIPYYAIYCIAIPSSYTGPLGWPVSINDRGEELAFLNFDEIFSSTPKVSE